ncbi:hypothetical protein L195_g060584, partial [Trifolium pratense]
MASWRLLLNIQRDRLYRRRMRMVFSSLSVPGEGMMGKETGTLHETEQDTGEGMTGKET